MGDRDYCDWVIRSSNSGDSRRELMELAQWLEELGFSSADAGSDSSEPGQRLVGFGKYKALTYEQLRDEDRDYGDWVLARATQGMMFAQNSCSSPSGCRSKRSKNFGALVIVPCPRSGSAECRWGSARA